MKIENKITAKLKDKANEIKQDISALYLVYKRKDVPVIAKIVIVIAVVYALSPIDLIPDFIPVLGYLDDLIILPFLTVIAIKLVPKKILEECREDAKDLWKGGKPKKWYYAMPIVIVWLIIIIIIVKNILAK